MTLQKIGFILVLIFVILLIIPLIYMVGGSFHPNIELLNIPPPIISRSMTLENYVNVFQYPILRWTLNSIIVAFCGSVLGCGINLLAGYAFAKKKFFGKEVIFNLFLITLIIPMQITLIPSFLIIKGLGLYNSLGAVILPCGLSAFAVFMFRRFIETIPDEYFMMATIDGCNEFQKITRILIPLVAPAIATILLLSFVGIWNNYLWQMIVLGDVELKTLPLGIVEIIHHENMADPSGAPGYGTMTATGVFGLLPVLLVFIFGQKYYLKGLFGSFKQ